MCQIPLLNSAIDSESLWMVLSILCTQSLFSNEDFTLFFFFYRNYIPFIYFSGHITETNTTNTKLKEATIVDIFVWFSLKVRGKCSIFQFYVYYWLHAFGSSLYQIKEIAF